eukprot:SAG31_NODE_162_length_21892_cov_343.171936_19_plen_57_part_00
MFRCSVYSRPFYLLNLVHVPVIGTSKWVNIFKIYSGYYAVTAVLVSGSSYMFMYSS